LREKVRATPMPEEARREAERELTRLERLPPASPEHSVIRTYLDWIVAMPWERELGGDIDVARARRVLDEDHYDLEKVKERILEYLAVKKLRHDRGLGAAHAAAPENGAVAGVDPDADDGRDGAVAEQPWAADEFHEPILC